MINPKELRIGNLVSHYGEVKSVSGTNYLGLIRLEQILDVSENAIEPILLTPEWLERCGFSKEPNDDCDDCETYSISKMDGGIAPGKDGWYLRIIHVDGYYQQKVGRKIEHVHQLQNLYFDLTGEELTINHV